MPTSFEALHEETRPLALLDDAAPQRPATQRPQGRAAVAGVTVLAVLVLVLVLI